MHWAGWSIVLLVLSLAGGCTPTFDWREARPAPGTVALFPCRPDTTTRQLVIAGEPVAMAITSCTAGDLTFAVGHLRVANAERIEPVKQVLRDALRVNLSAATPPASSPTAGPGGEWMVVEGVGADGQPIAARSQVVGRAADVFQATVIGRRLAAEPVDFFFSSLKWPP